MKENDIENYVKYKASVLDEVLTYLIADIADFRYHNSTAYKNDMQLIHGHTVLNGKKLGNIALKKLWTNFHVDSWLVKIICGNVRPYVDGKKKSVLHDILKRTRELSKYLIYVGKKDTMYKSGKKFARPSYWMIDVKQADEFFSKIESFKDVKNYSEAAREVISGIAFRYLTLRMMSKTKLVEQIEGMEMTKEEKEVLKKECEEGKHALSYECMLKLLNKDERSKLKRMKNRIRKLTQEAMAEMQQEIEKKDAQIAQLEAENEHLRSLKDVNSDVPLADHKLSYDELCNMYPDGLPEDFDFGQCSDDCMYRIQAEFEKEKAELDDDDIDDELDEDDTALLEQIASIKGMMKDIKADEHDEVKDEEQPAPAAQPQAEQERMMKLAKYHHDIQTLVNSNVLSKTEAERVWSIIDGRKHMPFKEACYGNCVQTMNAQHNAKRLAFFKYVKSTFNDNLGKQPTNMAWLDKKIYYCTEKQQDA